MDPNPTLAKNNSKWTKCLDVRSRGKNKDDPSRYWERQELSKQGYNSTGDSHNN